MKNFVQRSYLSRWLANQLSDVIENSFTRQMFMIISSLLLGIVFGFLMVYSILESGDAYKNLLSQFENAQIFIFISFLGLGLISAFLFYLTFHGPSFTKVPLETQSLQNIKSNAKSFLLNHFLDGFNAGVKKSNDLRTHLLTYERTSYEK